MNILLHHSVQSDLNVYKKTTIVDFYFPLESLIVVKGLSPCKSFCFQGLYNSQMMDHV
jgi:hypothetical protein